MKLQGRNSFAVSAALREAGQWAAGRQPLANLYATSDEEMVDRLCAEA